MCTSKKQGRNYRASITVSSHVYHPPCFTVILLSSSSPHPHHIRLCDNFHIISILTSSSHHLSSTSSHPPSSLMLLSSSSHLYLIFLIIILILSSNSSYHHLHFSFSSPLVLVLLAVSLNMSGYFVCCYNLYEMLGHFLVLWAESPSDLWHHSGSAVCCAPLAPISHRGSVL